MKARQILLAGLLALVPAAAWASSDRYAVFISDLHVGAGRSATGWIPTEDFRWNPEFSGFLDWLSRTSGGKADLVVAGDAFELWQSPTMKCSTDAVHPSCVIPDCHEQDTEIGCTEQEALARLRFTLDAHDDFIASLKKFVAEGSNTITFVPGNHDAALLFPAVRAELLRRVASPRVTVADRGYWLSADGGIYSDHGHQFDDMNTFQQWPSPFVERDGVRYLRKPWGENMVQQFYNQYEYVYPIIDNLGDEATGVEYAIKQTGFGGTFAAAGTFFRFFLFEESVRQAGGALGGKQGDKKIVWDAEQVRRKPLDFFMEMVDLDPVLKKNVAEARAKGAIAFDASQLTLDEIDAICAAKLERGDVVNPCPQSASNMGAAAKNLLTSPAERMRHYLLRVFPSVSARQENDPSVYVYGHTHSAVEPTPLDLGETARGLETVTYVNTGAFQRVASAQQITAILAGPAKGRVQYPLQLQPEDLPACYNFVWIPPYDDKPHPSLYNWTVADDGKYLQGRGACLARTVQTVRTAGMSTAPVN